MKNLYFLLIVLLATSCKQKETQINITPPITESIGTQISADSLKLPIIKQAGIPTVFEIPTKPGKSYLKTYSDGEVRKIDLLPPVTKALPVVVTDLNESTTPTTITPSKEQYPAAIGNFTTFTTDQGLALDAIVCSIKDRKGNLWFGTDGVGVSRYDGKSFTNFTIAQGLANNNIWSIIQDSKGNLWFGTSGGGVSCYDGKSFTNFTTAQGLANNNVLSITQDSKGNLWFGTSGGGMSRYDGKSFTNFTKTEGLANNTVRSITQDSKGYLWFGTAGGGVSRYDGKSFTNFTTAQGLAHNNVFCITEDSKGNLWFGTYGGGVSRYDGKSFTNFTTAQGLANNTVRSIIQDNKGNLWFGTSGGGVSRYDGKSFTNFTTAQGLANNTVWSITQDSKDNLWFCTYGGGVSRYYGKSFTNFTTAQGLANNTVLSITQDSKSNLWFGTYGGGVSCYDGKAFTNFTTAQGLANNNVWSLAQDNKGNLWFGTSGDGVSRYDGKSFTNFTTAQGLANNNVRSITQDSKGNLWFGTYGGGVSRYDGKSFTNYTTAQGLVNNNVFCITEDSKGNLWFGTSGGGVSRYDGKSFTNYTTAQGLASNNVWTITQDSKGNLWFGTAGGISLFCTRQKGPVGGYSLKSLSTKTGLAEDNAYGIVEDKQGNIFIGTNLGFTVLKGGIADDTGAVIKAKYGIDYYNTQTGYPVKDMCPNNMLIDNKGILWAGTGSDKTALVRFDYAALNRNSEPPVAFIQNVKLNNENICWYNQVSSRNKTEKDSAPNVADTATMILAQFNAFGKTVPQEILDSQKIRFSEVQFDGITKYYPLPQHLVLPYEHNNVSFDFNAIETGKPQLVNYQYILEGYDKEWSPLTKKTSATFGNIYEGTYTFKLKAQSPEGVWCAPVEYTFKVLPPWFRTWWIYSIDAVLIFILLFGIYRWRTAALRKDKIVLEETVVERTKEVVKQKEVAESQREIATAQKNIIEEKQKEILDSIHYASRIQQALLTGQDYIKENLKAEHFILFKPKDIVAGDFYWALNHHNLFYIATCDCTGHGVPGAFMSLLNLNFLNENVIGRKIIMPDEILNMQREEIIKALNPTGNENSKDGMDCVVCAYDLEKMLLSFAGAYNQPCIVRNGELIEFKGNKMSVGKHERDQELFTLQTVELKKGDTIYTFTDGYSDQFGVSNKKLKSKVLKEILVKISYLPMQEQKKYLDKFIEDWKGDIEQTDDILLIGVKI